MYPGAALKKYRFSQFDESGERPYAGHVLLDNRHGLVANVCLTAATGIAEREAALLLLRRLSGTDECAWRLLAVSLNPLLGRETPRTSQHSRAGAPPRSDSAFAPRWHWRSAPG